MTNKPTIYTCPMHPEIKSDKPGKCPICGGMDLVEQSTLSQLAPLAPQSQESYRPLVIIISLISLVTIVLSITQWLAGQWSWQQSMAYFMAGFFLVFSGFKLLDLKGFVDGYQTYDLLAKRIPAYGYVYPFLELGLGLLYATMAFPLFADIATVILLGFSGIGVAQKLRKHERFQCACLGTFLKVPLTKVTLVEDFGMAIMALIMLVMRLM